MEKIFSKKDYKMNWNEFWQSTLSAATDFALSFGLKLLAALIVLFVGFRLTASICRKVKKSKYFSKLDHSVSSFLLSVIGFTLKLAILLTVCAIMGIPMTSISAMVAAAGLAVGLALQGSLSNFAGGVLILIFRPFSVDDFISADGVSGTVVDITILYTIIRTADGLRIVVPNGNLSNAVVTNYSIEPLRRVDIKIGVAYDSDLEKVEKVLLSLTEGNEFILGNDKAPVVVPGEYADSSINLTLRVWVNRQDYWTVFNGLTKAIKPAFDANGIEIPFPQMDVHVKND